MTRLLLPWIGFAILQLGTPCATSAAELLRAGGGQTSVEPRPETQSTGALAPDRSRADSVQAAHVTPFAPTVPPRLPRALSRGTSPTGAPRASGAASLPHVLPDARAPPA